jgi:hypothetical protein
MLAADLRGNAKLLVIALAWLPHATLDNRG